MVEEKQERSVFCPSPPPGKIGLKSKCGYVLGFSKKFPTRASITSTLRVSPLLGKLDLKSVGPRSLSVRGDPPWVGQKTARKR